MNKHRLVAPARPDLEAVDLFSGSGWGVALQRLGIPEHGVENMPEAVATRAANGMRTWIEDVWDVLETADLDSPEFQAALLIASPPCQTFSMAGKGKGRQALDEVIRLIDERAYLDVSALRAFGEAHDPRTALVLTPLAYVARFTPLYVVLEQVPPVLPVWQRYAVELERWGYSVWTGNLQSEQYGVPQTRRRAVLIARADGVEAAPPTPTHSLYYSRDPQRLDEGVEPWVSMAEALGWGGDDLVGFARRDDGREATEDGYRARDLRRADLPAQHLTEKARSWTRGQRAIVERETAEGRRVAVKNMGRGMVERHGERPGRPADAPAFTIRANAGGTEPGGFVWRPEGMAGAGNSEHAGSGRQRPRDVDEPAHTITGGGSAAWRVETGQNSAQDRQGGTKVYSKSTDAPAPTVTGQTRSWRIVPPAPVDENGEPVGWVSGAADGRDVWERRPSTTIVASDVVAGPGYSNPVAGGVPRQARPGSVRVSIDEAAALQSFPPGFQFAGSKTKQFLQVGNAVPPGLAYAILSTIVDEG